MAAAAITGGEIEIKSCVPGHLTAVIAKLRDAGVQIEELNTSTLLVKRSSSGLKASDVTTEPHPHFPTDMQAQYMALMTQAEGESKIVETIFDLPGMGRYAYEGLQQRDYFVVLATTTLGGVMTFVVLLVSTTDICIPSMIYRSIFGWPPARDADAAMFRQE